MTDSKRHSTQTLRVYAEQSKALTHGDKTEDELLQRIWNLAGDVTAQTEAERLGVATSALAAAVRAVETGQ